MRLLTLAIFSSTILAFSSATYANSANATPPSETTETPIIHQIHQLVDQRNAASEVFVTALSSNDVNLQQAALLGLGRIGGKTILTRVAPFLTHKNDTLRQTAALALGISGEPEAAVYLWQQLAFESADKVKHEIYLGLGNLAENGLISRMLRRLEIETTIDAKGSLFHGLAIALVFHPELDENYSQVDFPKLLKLFSENSANSAQLALFLSRIPQIETYLSSEQLLPFTRLKLTPLSRIYLTKLIGKVIQPSAEANLKTANRAILAWLIEQSESEQLNQQIEAIRSMQKLISYPQSLAQLKKLHLDKNPLIAVTALSALAESELATDELIKLLENQLTNANPAMVVNAISGLLKRQTKAQMNWLNSLVDHPSSFVKIQLISLLKNKSESDFNAFFATLAKNQNQAQDVRDYAQYSLARLAPPKTLPAVSPDYQTALTLSRKKIKLTTTAGDIVIQLLPNAPFTSWHFINHAEQGYLNNSYFSRVIGNFVAQGGDSIGDGEGSSSTSIREEINFQNHQPMTVGMATSGKDTGSSQFFINTARNFHLDRNYTVFAKVISGQENVLKITMGTQVLSYEILN